MKKISLSEFKRKTSAYVLDNRVGDGYEFKMSKRGGVTLYSSCFAAMTLHYCNELDQFSKQEKSDWGRFLTSFQEEDTGYFLAPEIMVGDLSSADHDKEHLLLHFACHVLPTLDILGVKPDFDLQFVERYADQNFLVAWLSKRDLTSAWLEGNNLLFVGQLLLWQFNETNDLRYKKALDTWFAWLDENVDPRTGLWGTNGFSDTYAALYGGYHQLLLYFQQHHTVTSSGRLVDTVLSLQHMDGGYSKYQGGGTCQDIDAIDVLVNVYKRHNYRRREIRRSLRRGASAVLRRWKESGGFEDRLGHGFVHMGMEETRTPPGEANMFSTWFSVHALFLAFEVVGEDFLEGIELEWSFNPTASMGWHDKSLKVTESISRSEKYLDSGLIRCNMAIVNIYNVIKD